jgi:hypothetical protein
LQQLDDTSKQQACCKKTSHDNSLDLDDLLSLDFLVSFVFFFSLPEPFAQILACKMHLVLSTVKQRHRPAPAYNKYESQTAAVNMLVDKQPEEVR